MSTLALVATDTYRAVAAAVDAAARDGSIALVIGPRHTGKSEAIDQNAPDNAAYLGVPTHRSREQAIRTLLAGLTTARQQRGTSRTLLTVARQELHRRRPLLVIDPVVPEHEGLLALLTELYEEGDLAGLVLAGDPASDRVVHGAPGLRYSAAVTPAPPMTPAEVVECVPLLHPLFEQADPRDLLRLDAHYAYGYIGRWARCVDVAEHSAGDTTRLDRRLAEVVLAAVLRMAS